MMFNEKNVTVNEAPLSQWSQDLANALQAQFLGGGGETVVVTPKKVAKNNGVVLTGLEFRKSGENISPIIYVGELERRRLTVEEAADVVMEQYRRSCNPGFSVDNLSSMLRDWNTVKQYIIPALINRGRNLDSLEEVPHTLVGKDYAVIYKIRFPGIKEGLIKVTTSIFDVWNVKVEDLYKASLANLESEGAVLITMAEQIEEIFGEVLFPTEGIPMYILKNKTGVNGAATILLPGIREEILAKFDGAVYMIPSSVHEWIVVPATGDALDLADMIREVNQAAVAPEEVLGDKPVYLTTDGVNPFAQSTTVA